MFVLIKLVLECSEKGAQEMFDGGIESLFLN